MLAWLPRWLHPKGGSSDKLPRRPGSRKRPRFCRLEVEELESRLTPSGGGTALLNTALTSDPGVQQMPSIAADPHDAQHLVVVYMDRSLVNTGYAGLGAKVSYDGGSTWSQTAIPLPAGFDQGAASPSVLFDGQGHVFVSFQAATFLGPPAPLTSLTSTARTLGFQSNNGTFVARSDDGGLTWNTPVAVVAHLYDGAHPVPFELYPDLAIDTFSNLPDGQPNPNYGNLYEVWTRFYTTGQFPGDATATGGSDVYIAVSKDGGQTWQTQLENVPGIAVPVSVIQNPQNGGEVPAGLGFDTFPHPTVGPDGDVYVGLFEGGKFAVQHSTDAAASFAAPDFNSDDRFAFNLDAAIINNAGLPTDHFRTIVVRQIAADPARPGYVYAVETIRITDPSGNPIDAADVFFARSTDYGVTWSRSTMVGVHPALVLNDDNNAQSASGQDPNEVINGQALAHLAVDAQGNIGVIWYDTRSDPNAHRLDVFGTVSTDGGLTFSANFRVTDQSFDPDQGSFIDPTGQQDYYLGDATALALADGTAYAAWTDTRNGNQDIFFTSFAINPAPAPLNDRFEPNDTPQTATDLGQKVQLFVPKLALPVGDEDWFRVQATATGSLTVTASEAAPGSGLRLELWDAGGTTRLATGEDVLDSTGQVTGQQIVFPGASGQTYLIRVVALGAGAPLYSLKVQSLTADLGTLAHRIQSGTLAPGDQNYYLLSAAASGALEVDVIPGTGASGNFMVEVLDPNTLAVLATSSAFGSGGAHASLAVEQGQALLVHVFGAPATQGDFTLELTNLDQFSAPQSTSLVFPAGNGPSKVAVGDLNGDGFPDLVVSDFLANTVSVLLNNGDGTFQAPRQFAIGAVKTTFVPGVDTQVLDFRSRRDVRLADLRGNGILDIVVTNYDSGDVSVLLGNGDGTFQTQRRFDATPHPLGLAIGDLNNDGIPDLVVIDSTPANVPNNVAVLLGKGDGTFQPEKIFQVPSVLFLANIQLADFNHDGRLDLAVGGGQLNGIDLFLGNGDGTFTYNGHFDGGRQSAAMAVADFNGDGNPDLVMADFSELAGATVLLGNGAGGFQVPQTFFSGQGPDAIAVADFGSEVTLPDGSTVLGPPDGKPDLIVANSGQLTGTALLVGGPGIVVLPGIYDSKGFEGFGNPHLVAPAKGPTGLDVGDFNGDGVTDIAVADQDGVRVIFNKPPVIVPNATPQTARNLGTVVHLLEPTLTIVPGHEDAYFRLRVPTEAALGSGDEVLDFSALFEYTEGAGLQMEVRDADGHLLGSGPRFRVSAPQGAELLVHIFGVAGAGVLAQDGTGAYTLDIDVLPQLVSIEAPPLLPGAGQGPGGPTASLVLTFQGDRLDPATAEDPANYRVTWLGPDGVAGTADDRVIAIQGGSGNKSAVYDPSTNVNIASGNVYPTAIRQTVTLLFTDPLPAGSYQIDLSSAIQAAPFNDAEQGLLAGGAGLTGHPIVTRVGSQVTEGDRQTAPNLVLAAGALGDLGIFRTGTPFLTQLHDDLGALLDGELSQLGDSPVISGTINDQILDRFAPALGAPGQRPVGALVIWLDPVSPTLIDSGGNRIVFNQQASSFVNTFSQAYVNVTGNLEVIVLPFFATATATETLLLNVADVAATVRGGVVYLGADRNEVRQLTGDLRGGTTEFLLSFGSTFRSALTPALTLASDPNGEGLDPGSSRQATLISQGALVAQGDSDSPTLTQASFLLARTRIDTFSVIALGPHFQVNPSIGLEAVANAATEVAHGNGSGALAAEGSAATIQQLLSLFTEAERTLVAMARGIGDFLNALMVQLPVEGKRPAPEQPRKEAVPMPPPEEEEELLPQTPDAGGTMPEEAGLGDAGIKALAAPLPVEGNRLAPAQSPPDEVHMRLPPEEAEPLPQALEAKGGTPKERSPDAPCRTRAAEPSAGCFVSMVGLGVCVVGLSASGPIHQGRPPRPHDEDRKSKDHDIRHQGRTHE